MISADNKNRGRLMEEEKFLVDEKFNLFKLLDFIIKFLESVKFKVQQQEEKIQQLEEEIKTLKKETRKLKKKLYQYENPNTPPSQQRYYPRRNSGSTGKKLGAPKGHSGKTRVISKPELIVDRTRERCKYCSNKLGEPFYTEVRVVEEIPEPQPVKVIEYRIFYYKCPCCKRITQGSCKDIPKRGKFGNKLLTKVVLSRYEERLPLRKIADMLERDHNLSITSSTVLDMLKRIADVLFPLYIKIIKQLRKRFIVYVDETTIQVADKKWWIWGFVSKKEAVIVIREKRNEEVIKEILGEEFKNFIGCDGLKVYLRFTSNLQRDWAHILREAEFLSERIEEGKPLYEVLKEIYHKTTQERNKAKSLVERKRIYKNNYERLRYWIKKEWKNELLKRYSTKLKRAMKHLFTFILYPQIEPTTNRVERVLREQAVFRKIIGCLRNEKGVYIHEILTTLLTTWKFQQKNVRWQLLSTLGYP